MKETGNTLRDVLGLSLFIVASKVMQPETLVRLIDKINIRLADLRA